MTTSNDDLWRRRYQLFLVTRMFGVATFLLGIAIAFTNLIFAGGWPAVGAVVSIVGAIDAVFAPRMLKKLWAEQDAARKGGSAGEQ